MDERDEIQIIPTDESQTVPGDEGGQDIIPAGSGHETGGTVKKRRKRRKRTPEGTALGVREPESPESSPEKPRRKRRKRTPEGTAEDIHEPENPEDSPEKPRRKRRKRTPEGTALGVRESEGHEDSPEKPRKKRRTAPEAGGGGDSSEKPRKKRRTAPAAGGDGSSPEKPRKKRRAAPEAGSGGKTPEKPRRKRRAAPETGSGAERTGSGKTQKTRTEEIRPEDREKKLAYVDKLKALALGNTQMAWICKGLFCLLLFVIVLFVVRGIRDKDKGTETAVPAVTESVTDDSGLSAELTDLQKKTKTFLEDGAGAVDDNSITILGVGDNLVHEQVFLAAKTADGYDFRPFYKNVKQFISSADLATVNQETPLATSLGAPSGYPHFNTPTEMGDALIDTGFDVANMGNNHMLDMGIDGAYVTREYWDDHNIPCTGFYYGYDDLYDFRIINKNGIRVAFLSFVEMTNDELPYGYSSIIAYMNDNGLVESMLEEAKSEADIVVVHAHWGDENTDLTTEYVYDEAQRLVDWGADIVFGNHSHVLQDLVTLTRESDGQKCPVIFSLGNFFSAQKARNQLISGMLNVQVTKDTETGKVLPTAMGFLPIVTHYTGDRENLMLYPLSMYSQEMAKLHGTATVSSDGMPISLDYIETLLGNHIPAQYLGRMGPIQQEP